MNLRSVDLNLLVILDVLLDEAHVSRSSTRLGLSQPATSSALNRCRQLFRDPLLERSDGAMRLSPLAVTLQTPLKKLLAEAEGLIDFTPTPLSDIQQTIRIATADFLGSLVVQGLHERLRNTAPGIDLVLQPYNGMAAVLDGLTKGSMDLAISVMPNLDGIFRREILLRENWCVMMRQNHPASKGFDLDSWLSFPHIAVPYLSMTESDVRVPLDDRLAAIGRRRYVGLIVPSFMMIPRLVARSDLIAMLPRRCVPPQASAEFAVFDPPLRWTNFRFTWHGTCGATAILRSSM